VREYLAECLESVLSQAAPAGLEVIAVDDASPDGCGDLIEEMAAGDDRLRIVHLDRSRGPGNARNVGLARATGRYVWFVDGDDLLPPGAVDAIAARLARDEPDLLLIDYQDRYPNGTSGPSHGGQLLRSAAAGTCTLADAPQLINLTMTAWSKLFRREFLIGLNEPFRPGIHEDIPVTCAAMFAGRLSTLDQVCYCYRRSRPGSFMASTSPDHLAVFGAYAEVLESLRKLAADADPVATLAVQQAVFERAIGHYASVLDSSGFGIGPVGRPGRVPRGERRRFFERMHADYVRYRPAGYRPPPGARGAKFQLIARDSYWTYEALEPLNRLRVAARDLARRTAGQRG
jgi:CDP-glycerol glycerophosphotransferase